MATFPITVAAPPAAAQNIFSGGTTNNPGTFGPFGHGGNAYCILSTTQGGNDPCNVVCYKSSGADYGTWAEQDAANAPDVPANSGGFPRTGYAAVRHSTLPVIYVIYWGTDGFLHMKPFDMSTDTWGVDVGSALGYGASPAFGTENVLSHVPTAAYRGSDNSVWVSIVRSLGPSGATRAYAAKLLINSGTWDPNWTLVGTEDAVSLEFWWPVGMRADSQNRVHMIMQQTCTGFECLIGPGQFGRLWHQCIKTDNSLGAASLVYDSGIPGNDARPNSASYLSIGEDDRMIFTYKLPPFPNQVYIARAAAAEVPAWTVEIPDVLADPSVNRGSGVLSTGGIDYVFYIGPNLSGGNGHGYYYTTSPGIGEPWENPGTHIGDDPATNDIFTGGQITALSFNPIGLLMYLDDAPNFVFGQAFWAFGAAPPPPPTPRERQPLSGGGGTYFPRYLNLTLLSASMARTAVPASLSSWFEPPNSWSLCLMQEFALFKHIDRTLLSCGRKPSCVLNPDERAWVDAPAGSVTFNEQNAIALPAPASGDVVVLSFIVPFGYDGIVTAQFHQYTQAWLEGSGDLVWRVRANGRYLRDMGNMLSSIGSVQHLSPCPGGLWVHSGNRVEYIVSAPNTNGSLPPAGTGFIIASLHGWFFPRK